MDTYEQWGDVIDELDLHPNLSDQAREFILSIIEEQPLYLTPKQVAWLEDLKERYLA